MRPYEGKRTMAPEPHCKIKPREEGTFKSGLCAPLTIKEEPVERYFVHEGDEGLDPDVILAAYQEGKGVGELELRASSRKGYAVVSYVVTEPSARRCGVGTRLYEAAAKWACRRDLRLASDNIRSANSECFWRKQKARGRAHCEGRGRGMKIDERFQDNGEDWDCEFYALKKRMCFGTQPSLRGGSHRARKRKSTRRRR